MIWPWSKKKQGTRVVSLPGKVASMVIPNHYKTKLEQEDTLTLFPSGQNIVTLRVSSLSI